MKLKRILFNNIGLKLLALVLAFVTLLYVGEAAKVGSKKTVLRKLLLPSSSVTKTLRVEPIFVGAVPEGYAFLENDVTVSPEFVIVMGPSRVLAKKEAIYTESIDLSTLTKSRTLDVSLETFARSPKDRDAKVRVYIPVGKTEKRKP